MKSKVLNISFDKDLRKNSYDIVISNKLIRNPAPILKNILKRKCYCHSR